MSQDNTGQAHVAEISTQETGEYAPEDKIRIVLEGFRREVTGSDLCRREGIKPGVFYAWTKEFMEAGKERLTRYTVRDATRQEIEHLKRENYDLKQLVAGLSLEVLRFKKRPSQPSNGPGLPGLREIPWQTRQPPLSSFWAMLNFRR